MTAFFAAAVIGHVNVKHACYVADQFRDVNIPIAPAVSTTEVVKTAAVIGPSNAVLGSALTLRNGKRYFADLSSQQARSEESYSLLRAIGVEHPERNFAGTLWPMKHSIPWPFMVVGCR